MRKARARMLAPTISTSERVNNLNLKEALLYTWMIAHADDQGRLTGNEKTLKGLVVPLRDDFSIDDITKAIVNMDEVGLIRLYESEKGTLIQFTDWWDFQSLRDPQPSRYPAPNGWTDRIKSQARDDSGRFER